MPILPAFYRYLKAHRSQSGSSGPSSLSKKITNSFLDHRASNPKALKARPKDPFPLYSTKGYEELEEMEAQRQAKGLGGIVRGTEVSVVVEDRESGIS